MAADPLVLPDLHVSAVSSWSYDFDDDLVLWDFLGVSQVGLASWKLERIDYTHAARRTPTAASS